MAIVKQIEYIVENKPTGVIMGYHKIEEINILANNVNFTLLSYESDKSVQEGKGHLSRSYFSYPKGSSLNLFSEESQLAANTSITSLIDEQNLRFIGFLSGGIKA